MGRFYENSNMVSDSAESVKPKNEYVPFGVAEEETESEKEIRHPKLPHYEGPVTLDQLYAKHGGEGCVDDARAAVETWADPSTKSLLLGSDMGNDPSVISEILDFQKSAKQEIEDHVKKENSNNFCAGVCHRCALHLHRSQRCCRWRRHLLSYRVC